MRPELRTATLSDLPALARLHAQCFASPWDVEFLGRMLAQPGAFFMLATEMDNAAGFVIARVVAGEAEILSLGVLPDCRRKGLGSAMVRKAAEHAAQEGAVAIFLEVSTENDAARALYDRLGFCEVGRRPEYYRECEGLGRDALVLKRALPP